MKLSIVTLINNYDIYRDNVLKSTLKEFDNYYIEYIEIYNSISASSGLNEGIKKSNNDLIFCCHQDVQFLDRWYEQLIKLLNMLDEHEKNSDGKNIWGVCGSAGTSYSGKMFGVHSGLGMDGLDSVQVQTLDCCTLLLRKSIMKKYDMTFDENLKWYHMYGEDISLQSNDKGLKVYVLNVSLKHNCKWTAGGGFQESTDYTRKKWKSKFPVIHTTVGVF